SLCTFLNIIFIVPASLKRKSILPLQIYKLHMQGSPFGWNLRHILHSFIFWPHSGKEGFHCFKPSILSFVFYFCFCLDGLNQSSCSDWHIRYLLPALGYKLI